MAKLFKGDQGDDYYTQPVFGLRNRLARGLWWIVWIVAFRLSPQPLFFWRTWLLRIFGAEVGDGCYVYPSARIWAPWLLKLGNIATIGPGVEIYNPGGVEIGDKAIISQNAFLCGATHDYDDPAFPMTWKPIRISAYGWICARGVVLPGVTIGTGAILGAAAVTSRDLAPWSVYAGNPARLVGQRKKHI
jgi:putative colanic acid biosynthesis acetyltransferase WcaF